MIERFHGELLNFLTRPLGHLIALQIEEQLHKATSTKKATLGAEIERMCVLGAIAPDAWMQQASGSPVSAQPLLRATEKALIGLAVTASPGPTPKTSIPGSSPLMSNC